MDFTFDASADVSFGRSSVEEEVPNKRYETVVAASQEVVWQFHSSAEALRILTPPGRRVQVLGDDLSVVEGAVHQIRVRQFGLPLTWVARLSNVTPPKEFTDTAERSPFRLWRHRHRFEAIDDRHTRIVDEIEYALPFGFLGAIADQLFVSGDLDRLFAFRHQATARALDTGSDRL